FSSYSTDLFLRNVFFSYPDSSSEGINVNLKLSPGKLYGLSGSSGSGKTTLMNLIMGFLPLKSGQITLGALGQGGVVNPEWLNQYSFMPQTVFLTEGTLLWNITGQNEKDVDYDRLKNVIYTADLEDLISEVTLEYLIVHTVDGIGVGLSGGQRQRVGLAQCLYRQANFYLMDEPTASVSHDRAIVILERCKQFLKDKIVIISSHDINILSMSDEVIKFGSSDRTKQSMVKKVVNYKC
ncbi:ATP-binding cassette domain-containing protein, partial [Alphaproteobacteria bacterium]|nr:ATP-binding cassette domain-containing protein [Alphaproteobacteria bacterium]